MATYSAIWRFLLAKAPGMSEHLQTIVCECDDFLVSSIRDTLPRIKIRFSLIHFCRVSNGWKLMLRIIYALYVPYLYFLDKVLTSKWLALGLPQHDRNHEQLSEEHEFLSVLEYAWGLPLIQRDRFEEGVAAITTHAQPFIDQNYEMVAVFIVHLRKWIQIADIISIRRIPSRNNDIACAFNGQIVRLLGEQAPFFHFLST